MAERITPVPVLDIVVDETGLSLETLTTTPMGRNLLRLFKRLFTGRPLDADVDIMCALDMLEQEAALDKQRVGSGLKSNHRHPKRGAL